jgi:hypothetical protein
LQLVTGIRPPSNAHAEDPRTAIVTAVTGFPPRGHPAHPEMVAIYGPPLPPMRPSPSPQEVKRTEVRRREVHRALPQAEERIRDLLDGFIDSMAAAPPVEVVLKDSSHVETRRHLRYAPTHPRVGTVVGHGWYVATPRHSRLESSEATGLVVLTDRQVWSCTASTQLIALRRLSCATRVFEHTHGCPQSDLTAALLSEVPGALPALLDTAQQEPWRPPKPLTRRESKRELRRVYEYRDTQIYGAGGYEAYRRRTYGDRRSLTARLRDWFR